MPSQRYAAMVVRLAELRRNLLPAKWDATGTYAPRIYDRTLAFRMLAHAEFESFIEERALEHVDRAMKSWLAGARAHHCLLALVAYRAAVGAEPSSILKPPQKPSPDLRDRVESAFNEYSYYVRRKNNGIKEVNLLRILLPLGIAEADIDQQWLATTEAWATSRGQSAHSTGKVQVQPDPKHEFNTVKDIKDGFRGIDKLLK
jgi:hypothetical protein